MHFLSEGNFVLVMLVFFRKLDAYANRADACTHAFLRALITMKLRWSSKKKNQTSAEQELRAQNLVVLLVSFIIFNGIFILS